MLLTGPMTPPNAHEKPKTAYAREALVSSVMSRIDPRNYESAIPLVIRQMIGYTHHADSAAKDTLD